MSRDNPRGAQGRALIAMQAAKLLAEHGIRDYALAKRKAARQLGVPVRHGLPSNEEVEQALLAYQTLFEPEYRQGLVEMRRQALDVMSVLERFEPHLTGGLVHGAVSRHSEIEIEIHADSSKEFEQFLLNGEIEFRVEERRGGAHFLLYGAPADVRVRVLPRQLQQSQPRVPGDSRRRLSTDQLRRLLQAEGVAAGGGSAGGE